MATFEQRKSGRWQAKIRRNGHPALSRTFDSETETEAQSWADFIEKRISLGIFKPDDVNLLTNDQEKNIEKLNLLKAQEIEKLVRLERRKARKIKAIERVKANQEAARLALNQRALSPLEQQVVAYIERSAKMQIHYENLLYDLSLVLMALHKVVGNSILMNGTFPAIAAINLMPFSHIYALQILVNNSVIFGLPNDERVGGFELSDDGQLTFTLSQVNYCLMWQEGSSVESAFAITEQRKPSSADEVIRLWYELQKQECLAYFNEQCSQHGFRFGHEVTQEIWSAIEAIVLNALPDFSTSNLWAEIWKVVRDAALLTNREYYNSQSAAKTLPGKLQRAINKLRRGDAAAQSWRRSATSSDSGLSLVFWERFALGINENGKFAENAILKICADVGSTEKPNDEETLKMFHLLMNNASEQSLAGEVALSFGDYRNAGKTVFESMCALVKKFPSIG